MLNNAKQMRASFHAELYNFIPQDHLLRKINEAVDFGLIHELVKGAYCEFYGRPAHEPAKYRGLFRMRIQAYLTAFVVNAKRMVKLLDKMQLAL